MGQRLNSYLRGLVLTAPGPTGRQMWRSIGSIRRAPMDFLADMARQYGDIVQFPVPVPPSYFINDPEHVRQVLVGNARNTDKQTMQYRGLSVLTGDGLLTCDPPLWRNRRQVVQPAFHHEAVARMKGDIEAATGDALTRWRGQQTIDVEAEMMALALDIVGRTLFGADISADAADLSHRTVRALDAVVNRAQQPLRAPLGIPTPGNLRLRAAIRALDAAVAQLLAERRVDRPESPTMLDLIVDAYGFRPGAVVPKQVRDEIVTFIVAGHETVASGLTWALHLLMSDAASWQVLATADHVNATALARSAFEESLRLFPPAWLITRRTIAGDELGTVSVPAGSLLIMSPWVVHRDSRWWSNPDAFDIGRFLIPDAVPRTAYFPFGAGARMCIGRDMALLEGAVVLQRLAREVVLTTASDNPVGINASVTLRPAAPVVAHLDWTTP